MKTYIHYGSDKWDMTMFDPIQNIPFRNKPAGGLWVSDVDAEYGWDKWNEDNEFVKCEKKNSFLIHLNQQANIFVIDSLEKADHLFEKYGISMPGMPIELKKSIGALDFEQMRSDGIDAIDYRVSQCGALYMAMYGWDCDSVLILNPWIVEPEIQRTENSYENDSSIKLYRQAMHIAQENMGRIGYLQKNLAEEIDQLREKLKEAEKKLERIAMLPESEKAKNAELIAQSEETLKYLKGELAKMEERYKNNCMISELTQDSINTVDGWIQQRIQELEEGKEDKEEAEETPEAVAHEDDDIEYDDDDKRDDDGEPEI